ncbi:MAG: ABC transporter ATP-binding protein/permease [Oscillospiraceae bacterium]|nr:ABC transporter ATP-binding protein/permease [Oscillospiraceae bacterium]
MKEKKIKDKNQNKKRRSWRLPEEVLTLLEARGLSTRDFLFCATGDMDPEGNYAAVWLAFDAKGVYLAFGRERVTKKKGNKRLALSYELDSLQAIPMEDIGRLKVERYVATGRLILVDKGGAEGEEGKDIALSRFSIGLTGDMQRFCDCVNACKEGKDMAALLADTDERLYCPKCGERYPYRRQVCPKCIKKSSTVRRLFEFFGGYKKQIGVILGLLLLQTGFMVALPTVSTKTLFDKVLNEDNSHSMEERFAMLGWLVLAIIGMRLLDMALKSSYDFISAGIMPRVIYDIKLRIFTAMQRLSVGFYSSKQTGQLMERVTKDAEAIYWFFIDGLPFITLNVVMLLGSFGMMFYLSWRLTSIVFLVIPILILVAFTGDKVFRRLHHRRWAAGARLSSMVSDNINGQRVIKAFSQEGAELDRFGAVSAGQRDAEIALDNKESTLFPLLAGVIYVLTTIVLVLGGGQVLGGEMSIGSLLTYTVYLTMIQGPIEFLSQVFNWWARCVDAAQRVFEIVDAEPEIEERENPVALEEFRGAVELSELEFEYEPARPIIKKLSLRIEPGKMLGIVGKTGAGKTTLANLISRLYDVKAGVIRIDGVDVKDLPLGLLRRNIGLVSQDIYLFSGTIMDNIRYAKPEAALSEVMAAAKAAAAHDFIMKLPDSYETRVGNGGQDLSGGERQRVSIARAILQNPKILILDEATAAMDTATERSIQESLQALKAGRTTIAIAHRLSTLRDADTLAVIEQGELKECGSFAELIRQKGEFYKLYQIQNQALAGLGVAE